jgi:cytochrome c oxidase assembly protein subunit 11
MAFFQRARRNAYGHLEPDAAEDVVQKSLGFDTFEHAPKGAISKETNSS